MTDEELAAFLEEQGHIWKIKGGTEIKPTAKDVRQAIDRAKSSLYNDGVGSLVVFAGLLIYKTENGYDVYINAGEEKSV